MNVLGECDLLGKSEIRFLPLTNIKKKVTASRWRLIQSPKLVKLQIRNCGGLRINGSWVSQLLPSGLRDLGKDAAGRLLRGRDCSELLQKQCFGGTIVPVHTRTQAAVAVRAHYLH